MYVGTSRVMTLLRYRIPLLRSMEFKSIATIQAM